MEKGLTKKVKRTLWKGKVVEYDWVVVKKKISNDDWDNYKITFNHVDPESRIILKKPIDYSAKHEWDFVKHEVEPVCCSVFGCGKHLTLQEQLFGNKCNSHQK